MCDGTKNRVLDNNKCKCQIGYYDDGINEQCLKCHKKCKECVNKRDNCTVCADNMVTY